VIINHLLGKLLHLIILGFLQCQLCLCDINLVRRRYNSYNLRICGRCPSALLCKSSRAQ
jgi:hypothetical protein